MKQAMPAYEPILVGQLQGAESLTVFGAARNPITSTMVALSVQGPSTQIERLWATLYGMQNDTVTITITPFRDISYERQFAPRYMYAQRGAYSQAVKTSISDSMDFSMIIMHKAFSREAEAKDQPFFYEPFVSDEDMIPRVFDRVRKIVSVYVSPKWASYLYNEGKFEKAGKSPLVGRIPNYKQNHLQWACAGFDIAYVTVDAEAWEAVISAGLRKGAITLGG